MEFPIPGLCAIIFSNEPKVLAMKAITYIEHGKFDTTPLIIDRFKLEDIEEAYHIFENKLDGVIKIAINP